MYYEFLLSVVIRRTVILIKEIFDVEYILLTRLFPIDSL